MSSKYPSRIVVFAVFALCSLALVLLLAVQKAAQAAESQPVLAPAAAQACSLTVNVAGSGTVEQMRTNVDPELKIELDPTRQYAELENSVLRVRYERYTDQNDGSEQFTIREFRLKRVDLDQAGPGYLDAGYNRAALTSAEVVYDGEDRKTLRLEWTSKPDVGLPPNQKLISEISIFPNSPFIKIDYIDIDWAVVIVDLGRPGGVANGQHAAYGGDSWVRGYVAAPDTYYSRVPADGLNDPADGGSLNYNDHFILAAYNPANNVGYGRTMPIADTRAIKLLFSANARQGFEWFPPQPPDDNIPYTSFIFAATGGPDELIALGKTLVDDTTGDYGDQCGETVELTAVPAEGWYFNFWSGDLTGRNNPSSITLTGNHVVTANFGSDLYDLDVSVTPANGSGGSVDISPQKPSYQYGEEVTLTAQPQPGWSFDGWGGDLSGNELTRTISMTADRSVTATFTQDQYTLELNVVGNGRIIREPDRPTYTYGTAVILTAVPDPGWSLAGWTNAPLGNPTFVEMQGDTAVTATFTQDQYTISLSANGPGSVSIFPDKPFYVYGDEVTFIAVPQSGRFFTGWRGDLHGATNPYTISVRGSMEVVGRFSAAPPPVYAPMVVSGR